MLILQQVMHARHVYQQYQIVCNVRIHLHVFNASPVITHQVQQERLLALLAQQVARNVYQD